MYGSSLGSPFGELDGSKAPLASIEKNWKLFQLPPRCGGGADGLDERCSFCFAPKMLMSLWPFRILYTKKTTKTITNVAAI